LEGGLAVNPTPAQLGQAVRRSVGRRASGQAVALFAVVIPVTVLFALGIFDYMVTTVRVMETLAAADLGAHAGAQIVKLQPDGRIVVDNPAARATAASYFNLQAPEGAVLHGVVCRLEQARPTCRLAASVPSAGYLIPQRTILVEAVGELAYGATRDDQ
jgi:hypothetical protein